MDAQAGKELLAAIQTFVGRHQEATDGKGQGALRREPRVVCQLVCHAATPNTQTELENTHLDRCIDEAQEVSA